MLIRVTRMHSPGGIHAQGRVATTASDCAALSMLPQVDSGIWMPRPRKLRADSERIALGTPKVKATSAGEMALGRMYLVIMTPFLVPMARAASTYSFS